MHLCARPRTDADRRLTEDDESARLLAPDVSSVVQPTGSVPSVSRTVAVEARARIDQVVRTLLAASVRLADDDAAPRLNALCTSIVDRHLKNRLRIVDRYLKNRLRLLVEWLLFDETFPLTSNHRFSGRIISNQCCEKYALWWGVGGGEGRGGWWQAAPYLVRYLRYTVDDTVPKMTIRTRGSLPDKALNSLVSSGEDSNYYLFSE